MSLSDGIDISGFPPFDASALAQPGAAPDPSAMSDEELMQEMQRNGLAPTAVDPSKLTDEQLLAEMQKAGLTPPPAPDAQPSATLQTGTKAFLPETETQAKNALDMGASGVKDIGQAVSPLVSLAKMAMGKPLSKEEGDYLDQDGVSGAISPLYDVVKGLGKGALASLGTLFSPLSGANRAFVANSLQNATGIPAGLTDAAMSLVEPAGLTKLAKLADLPGLMETMSAAADLPTAEKTAAPAAEASEAAAKPSGLNIFKGDRQILPTDTLAEVAGVKPISEVPPQVAAQEVAGSTTAPGATGSMQFPMTGGEASQDANLQRFEADALSGTKGAQAQQAMMTARAAKSQAANDSISQLGNFRPDGSPSDELGSAVGVIRANSDAAKAAVNTAYKAAREIGGSVTVPAMDAATNLVPDMSSMMASERFNATTTPKAYSMYEDLLKTIGGDGKVPLQAPVLLQDGEDWRRAASQMAANTTDPSEGLALRKMIGVYDNYMSGVGDRLQGGTADAVNAFKDAVATRAEYGQRFEGNDLVQNVIRSGNKSIAGGNGMSVDDLTKQFIGSGNLAGRQGMLDDANSMMRAAGDQAPLVQQHLQNALAQNIYDKTAGAKVAGTDVSGINLGALQTHLENLFIKQKEMATSVFGSDTVADAQNAIKQLDMINSKQPSVGNISNSGYTALRGLADHTPVFSWLNKGLKAMKEAGYGQEAAQTAAGAVPSRFVGSGASLPVGKLGVAGAASGAADRNQ